LKLGEFNFKVHYIKPTAKHYVVHLQPEFTYSEKLYAIEYPEIMTQGEMLEKFEEIKEAYF